jgi:hypothetical protein
MQFVLSSGSKVLIHLSVLDVRNYTSDGIFQCITAIVIYLSLALAFVYCRINTLFTEVKTGMKFASVNNMKVYRWRRGAVPLILNLGTRWQ